MSFSQAPILEIAPLLEGITLNSNSFTPEAINVIFNDLYPFVNKFYNPIIKKKNYEFSNNNEESDSSSIFDILEKSVNSSQYYKHNKNKSKNSNKTYNNNNNNNYSKDASNNLNIENNSQNNSNNILLNKKRPRPTFDKLHDNLLAIGINTFGKKNIEAIQKYFLDNKKTQEIKHRIKNLTCQKASDNIIKQIKLKQETSLNKTELELFLNGIKWFGTKDKWVLISRFFIPYRTPEYLENVYNILIRLNHLIDFENKYLQDKNIRKQNNKTKNKELDSFEKKINDLAIENKKLIDQTNEYNSFESNNTNNISKLIDNLLYTNSSEYDEIYLDDYDSNEIAKVNNEEEFEYFINNNNDSKCSNLINLNNNLIKVNENENKINSKKSTASNEININFKNCIKRRYGQLRVIFANDRPESYEKIELDN